MTHNDSAALPSDPPRLWSRALSAAALWLCAFMVAACGGGGETSAVDVTHRLVSQKNYPAALAVRVTSSRIEFDAQGVERVGGSRVKPDVRFPLGSLTKSLTATLAGILVQDGRLSWDSRLLDVLPELVMGARTEYAEVTLRDLLAHRGGIAAVTTAEQAAAVPDLTGTPREQRAQFVAWAVAQVPAVTPRAQTQYSNGGYAAAAAMLERVMDLDYESLVQSRLFDPLGLHPVFGAAGANPGEAWGHVAKASGWSPLDPADAGDPPVADPFGGAKVSGHELGVYLQMHLRALRGVRGLVITPETASVLHTTVRDGYALGWVAGTDRAQRPLTWHNGSDGTSYYALAAVSEVCDCASAVLVNAFGPSVEADANDGVLDLLHR
jgi:CubicO group peptidase (beta-lactamase class C family)